MGAGRSKSAVVLGGLTLGLVLALAAATRADDSPPEIPGLEPGGGGGSLPSLREVRGPALRLFLFDPTKTLAESTLEAMGLEVRSIFRDLSVDVSFEVAEDGTNFGMGPGLEIPVIVLPQDPDRGRRKKRVLGLVVKEQQPERAIWAFVDNVRWTLGKTPRPGLGTIASEQSEIGIALGRVIAHEIVHAIAPDEPHARKGLMNHSFDRAFLVGDHAALDERCSRAFLSRLSAHAAEEARPAGTASAAGSLSAAR
jgi:hypothetical protein